MKRIYKDSFIRKYSYEGKLKKWHIDGKDAHKERSRLDRGHWSMSAI